MRLFLLIFTLLLAGCQSRVIYKDRVVTVTKPVATPCVSGERPPAVKSLKEKYPDWYEKSPKQQAELFALQVIEENSYGKLLDAATSACP